MAKSTRIARGKQAVRSVLKRAETRVMAAAGRRAVKNKVRTAKKVGKKVAKAGLLLGALAAVGVAASKARKRNHK